MSPELKAAVLRMYDKQKEAKQKQAEQGKHDQGNRSGVTAGSHFAEVAELIREDLIRRCGFAPNAVCLRAECLKLPGWFRPTKDWDIIAYHGDSLVAAIELKSISSSFGNNANNRTEEALGAASDIRIAHQKGLLGDARVPPILGYVLIVAETEESTTVRAKKPAQAKYPIDPAFEGISYIERFRLLCERLQSESIYQAVWYVTANPKTDEVHEPSPKLSYESFLAVLEGSLSQHKG